VAAGVGWSGLLLGPSCVGVLDMGTLADRYSYLPLFGFTVAAVAAVRAATRRAAPIRWSSLGASALWAVAIATTTLTLVPTWRDNWTLYQHALAEEPQSARAHYRIGYLLARAGRPSAALPFFERAVALDPQNPFALNNLAVTYLELGRTADAERAARLVLERSRGAHFRAWYNLAAILDQRGDRRGSCAAVREALAIHPAYAKARAERPRFCAGLEP
jgi:tetratricopeptide (TPR) repeat protein